MFKKGDNQKMREITELKEIQELELGVLEFIDNICRENNIKYTINYGTLIGAIRHKGFIPWDDDIDISMTRDEYNKFCAVMKSKQSRYQLLCVENIPNYDSPLAKVVDTKTLLIEHRSEEREYELGIYVDVFIVDKLAQNSLLRKLQLIITRGLNSVWGVANTKLSVIVSENLIKYTIRCIVKGISKILGQRNIVYLIRLVSTLCDNGDNQFIGSIQFWGEDFCVPQAWFSEYIPVDFCGEQFLAVKYYDELLKHEYGNYMQLPPEDERVPGHSFVAYWKD